MSDMVHYRDMNDMLHYRHSCDMLHHRGTSDMPHHRDMSDMQQGDIAHQPAAAMVYLLRQGLGGVG